MSDIESEEERATAGLAYTTWLVQHSKLPILGQGFEAGWRAGRDWALARPPVAQDDEDIVSERAERALKTNAEAYRLAQEALDMRRERDAAGEQISRLRAFVQRLVDLDVPEGDEVAALNALKWAAPLALAASGTATD